MIEPSQFLEASLACPTCRAALADRPEGYRCRGCGAQFARTGAYVDFIDRADPLLSGLQTDFTDHYDPPDTPYWRALRLATERYSASLPALFSSLLGRPARCLDIGASQLARGRLKPHLEEYARTTTVFCGIDPDAKQLARADDRLIILRGAGERLPFAGGSFDLVLIHSTLDHCVDSGRALDECARVLAPGGVASIMLNNDRSWAKRLLPWEARRRRRLAADHHHAFFHPRALGEELRRRGFEIVRVRGLRYLLLPASVLELAARACGGRTPRALSWIDRLGTRWAPTLGADFHVVARKRVSPCFSVIIPAYQAERFLEGALDAAIGQALPAHEIIVVDDGSTDGTLARLEAWALRHPAVALAVIRQPHQGIGQARNAGIRAATGEHLAFLDADDLWDARKLQAVAEHLRRSPEAELVCHDEWLQEEGGRRRPLRHGPYATYRDLLLRGNTLSTSAIVVRRSRVVDAGGFSSDLQLNGVEDYDLWLRLARAGCRIEYVHERLGTYRVHGAGVTSRAEEHAEHLLAVLDAHAAARASWTPRDRSLMRRRRAAACRGAGRALMERGAHQSARPWLARALREDPLSWKTRMLLLMHRCGGALRSVPPAAPVHHGREALERLLCCPACRGDLAWTEGAVAIRCLGCEAAYPIREGIPVLLPSAPSLQEREQRFRDRLASAQRDRGRAALLAEVARHHCVPVMRRQAERFRAEFRPQDWILDLGIGYGWHWAGESGGARVLGVDLSLGNLMLARQLLGEARDDVVLVCADAAALPIRARAIAGLWSVQTFQHFPSEVLRAVLRELDRVMQEACVIESSNVQPSVMEQALYRLAGKRLHRRGRLGEMELHRRTRAEWLAVWRTFRGGRARIRSSYSELFFHPDVRLRPAPYPVRLEAALSRWTPSLAALMARQAQVRVELSGGGDAGR